MITEDGKIEFNEQEQAEVNRIIGDRLARESVHDMKEIIEELKQFGYEGTPAEIKVAVKQQAAEFKQAQQEEMEQQRLDELREQAREEGTTPQLLAKIEKLEQKLSDIDNERRAKEQAEQHKKVEQEQYIAQIQEFKEKYESIDLDKLLKNEDFADFYENANQKLSLLQIYERYTKYATDAQQKAIAKIQANQERSTSSGKSKGDSTGGTYGLSASDINTVDEWNMKNPHLRMSYKEFSERNGGK